MKKAQPKTANNAKNTLKPRTKYDTVDNRNKKNQTKIQTNIDKATKKA